MASGSKGDESRVLSRLFGSSCLKLLYACTYSTVAFLGSRGDNRTAKNPGDVLVHLVHLGCGTLQVV